MPHSVRFRVFFGSYIALYMPFLYMIYIIYPPLRCSYAVMHIIPYSQNPFGLIEDFSPECRENL